MGFFDETAGGGGAALMKWNGNEGSFLTRDGDAAFNGQEFILNAVGINGGYIKFAGKGERPERHLAALYPQDETPVRTDLGDTDRNKWPIGRFSGVPEDPWTPIVELPLKHRETGEEYILSLQTKTSIGAARDLLAHLRRLPNGHDPVIRLATGSMKTKFGVKKKPVFTIVGKTPTNGKGADGTNTIFNDDVGF
jgi:hypothetical protein